MTVEDRLRDAQPPEPEAARERARRVILAATPARARRRRRLPAVLLTVVVAAGVALTPPGDALARWIEDLVNVDATAPPPPEPRLERLPATGQLLATGRGQAWVIARDGSRRRLGAYDDVTWSPRGLFVAAAREQRLQAIDTDGTIRWFVDAPDSVTDPRWSPSGFRVAYRSGDDLWVVAGDGSQPRALVEDAALPAAWRPGPDHVLAAARDDGTVEVWSVDDGRRRARTEAFGTPPVALLWIDPTTLVIVRPRELQIARVVVGLGALRGRAIVTRRAPIEGPASAAALLDGEIVTAEGRNVVSRSLHNLSAPRLRLTAAGDVSDFVPSPSGKRLLVASDAADQWVFLAARPARAVRAVTISGLSTVSDWQTEPLASAALSDGRRIAISAEPGGCLVVTGVDAFDRRCGRAPSKREPQPRGDLMAGPIAQASPDEPYEVYGETSAAVERVRLTYRTGGGGGEQYALVLRARDRAVLRRAGIDEPFGYYFAELPPDATAIVATAYDAQGAVLASEGYANYHDLPPRAFINGERAVEPTRLIDVSPRVGGRFARFRLRLLSPRRTGVFGAQRRSYTASAASVDRRQDGVCRSDGGARFPSAPSGDLVRATIALEGEGSPEGWCPGRYRGTITFNRAHACPARGACDVPADAPDVRRVVGRFTFRVRP